MTTIAVGYNCFETKRAPEGEVLYLANPQSVIKLIQSGKLKQHILLVQGGTTTFLAPALSMGAAGVITLSGAPESHLGILSREFQMPCVMTAYLVDDETRYVTGGNNETHFAKMISLLNGKRVRLDCSHVEQGKVVEIA
ncbi:MAG: PEP-utilizing enzyme [Janthinobacterium lividum]